MTDKLIRPVLGKQEMEAVSERLVMLYLKVRDLDDEAYAARSGEETFPLITLQEILATPIRAQIDCVEDAKTGLEYAAWVIGETLAGCGGMDLMHLVFGMFEAVTGPRGASWLDHRWDGVNIPGGGIWCA